jgi:hypothetical protein
MYELTYHSTAKRNLNEEEISSLLKEARAFNSKNDITGCLVYYKQEFVQIMEGDSEVILELYSKITNDSRHSDVVLLNKGDKHERSFKNWNMAFHQFSEDDVNDLRENLFVKNLGAFSQLVNQSSLSTMLFWNKIKALVGEEPC